MLKKLKFEEGKTYTCDEIRVILKGAVEPVTNEILKKMTDNKKPKGDMEKLRLAMEELKVICELQLFQMYVFGEDIKTKRGRKYE